ncbi:MAG: alkaline phosphatase family protein [Candidatus Marinimicrobia bacterium]|nr:alkaline phosphatase family protein [Candidatus Neomarinimicrobiota bacterium]
MKTSKKVILIGLDGLMPEQIERYRDDIPELDKLLREGFFSPAIPSAVTCTATNWPTIATGAWMGTHGCIGFNDHLPGMGIGESVPTGSRSPSGARWREHLMDGDIQTASRVASSSMRAAMSRRWN